MLPLKQGEANMQHVFEPVENMLSTFFDIHEVTDSAVYWQESGATIRTMILGVTI